METIIENFTSTLNKKINNMPNFEFLGKSVIGILGTTLTILLENVSVVISIVAGLATIIYMVYQTVSLAQKNDRAETIFQQKQEDREKNNS